ncbi:MAG TPA: HepT-like ribonuclease domain-containing protein [Nitrobacter sp.]|jgi:uncharacterized protein with HEPN domain|nr:HepT-like ribonuclease domain-containing protein [Nitrobacter sp.]
MPPTQSDRLRDILEAIAEIEALCNGRTLADFVSDRITRMATERMLETVCEASRRPSDEIEAAAPEIDWRTVIDFGNVLRHAYHATRPELVWDVLQDDLPALRAFAENQMQQRSGS